MIEPVSVIVTCFNLERYIEAAISSVLKQNYDSEVQIIVVDDCSTDQSRKILKGISGIETVLLTNNGGVMKAMIAGLRKARYDKIFFLDGDDVWHPQKLLYCMTQSSEKTKFYTHDLWRMDSNAELIMVANEVEEVLARANKSSQQMLIEKCLLEHKGYVWLGSAFGVSRLQGNIDGFIQFCEQQGYLESCYQDWPLAVWVALEPNGIMEFIPKKLFGYRIHDENYSGASQTLEKYRRNLTKSRDTMTLILAIISFKRGNASTLANYQRIHMRYELLLATTQSDPQRLVKLLFRARQQFGADWESAKIIIRVILALLIGPQTTHTLLEKLKK